MTDPTPNAPVAALIAELRQYLAAWGPTGPALADDLLHRAADALEQQTMAHERAVLALVAERDALAKDAGRLDWLETHPIVVPVRNNGSEGWLTASKLFMEPAKAPTLRAAIDLANAIDAAATEGRG